MLVGPGNNGVFSVKFSYEKLLVREEHVFPCRSMDSKGAEEGELFHLASF